MAKAQLIVNGVLCYISSARSTHTDQTILSVCQSFYNCEKIVEAKELLFSTTGETVIQRRGESRIKADLKDLIGEFRRTDENGIELPTFVADNFASMPPASGFEVLSEHLVSLLSEVSALRQQVCELGEHVEAVKDSKVTDIKEDLYDIKTALFKKNNEPINQPPLYSNVTARDSLNSSDKISNNEVRLKEHNNRSGDKGRWLPQRNEANKNKENDSGHQSGHSTSATDETTSSGEVPDDVDINNIDRQEPWKLVRRNKRKREIITGKKKTDSSGIRGIVKTLDIYVGRCDKSVDCALISNYIENDLNVNVTECICVSNKDSKVNSFKVTVRACDRDSLLQDNLWPENICVRKYFKSRNNGG